VRFALAVALAVLVGFAFRPGDAGLALRVLVTLFGAAFIAAAALDVERRTIPNRLVYPAALLAVAVEPLWPGRSPNDSVLGGVVALVVCMVFGAIGPIGSRALRKPITGVGAGDLKLLVLVGLVVAWPGIVIAVWVTAVAAAITTCAATLTGGAGKPYPLGPSVAAGGIAALAYISLFAG
jgi:prepilin signal peptidase PulO-like enzyme (type II secretory pathway)